MLGTTVLYVQQAQKKPFQQQSQSTIAYKNANNSDSVEIQNVAYELAGPGIAGRPKDERLVLRKTTRTTMPKLLSCFARTLTRLEPLRSQAAP